MKKLLYSILALTGLTMASCTQEHIDVQYIPENAVAPTLGEIQGCALEDGGADIVVEYTKADFGVATAQAHALYVSKSEDMADMKKAKATFGDTTITMTQADINIAALDFAAAGEEVDMYFAIVANLNTDKGAAVAGTELQSNVVKATFKSFVADILPTEKFDKVWVIGDYCGWAHDKTQFLFDYTSSGNVYTGVVDFNKDGASAAANGFKLTGVAGWDDTCNWGLEDNTTATAEASSLQLITGGGSQDIKCYSKRFYGFEYDKTAMVLKKTWGADQIGIIGLNGDWETDIVMEYNPKWTRFYADIEAPADTEMKFRADAAWDLNWGVDCAQGGGNIPVAAGNYRVYFNPATGLIEFSASKYGTEEDTANGGGTTPEPEPQPGIEENRWGVVGTINEWGGTPDLYMNEVGENLYVRMGVTVTDADQFKVRFNNGWDINYGAAGDVEPFAVTVGEEMTLVSGGKNLSAPAGTYDIYFNIVDYKMWVMPQGETPGGVEVKAVKLYADVKATGWETCNIYGWGDLGEFAGTWPGTALSTETVDGKEYYAYTFDVSAIGKTVNVIFNNGSEQTVNIENIVLDKDYIFTLTEKDANGKWLATINGEAPEKPAVTTYGILGEFNGWGEDVDLVARGDGWYVTEGLSVTAGKLLIRLNDAWDEKFGNDGSTLVIGENALTYGGADMLIETGTFDFYFNPSTSKLFLVNAGDEDPTAGVSDVWTIKGDVNNTQWNNGEVTTEAVDGFYVAKNVTFQDSWNEGANFKVLKNGTWMGSVAGGTHNVGDAIAVSESGGNITMNVTLDTPYDIYIDGANNNVYVVEAGATPAI